MKSVLEKVMAMPDKDIADDDHPNKPDISKKDFIGAMKELVAKHKDDPVVTPKKKKSKKG